MVESPSPEINRLYVLVHPFFTVMGMNLYFMRGYKTSFKYLWRMWGDRILKASANPHAILVLVKATPERSLDQLEIYDSKQWKIFDRRIERLYAFARKKMGKDRLFEYIDEVKPMTFQRDFQSRGLVLSWKKSAIRSSRVRTIAFGEYLHWCVDTQSRNVMKAFNAYSGRRIVDKKASVETGFWRKRPDDLVRLRAAQRRRRALKK